MKNKFQHNETSTGGAMKWIELLMTISLLGFAGFVWADEQSWIAKSPDELIAQLDQAPTPPEWLEVKKALAGLGQQAVPAMQNYVRDPDKDGRKRMMVCEVLLEKMTPNDQTTELRRALSNDPDPMFRTQCVLYVGNKKIESFRGQLQKILNDKQENGMVQVSAAIALASMGDASGKVRALQAIIKGEPWADMGINVLEVLKAKETIPELQSHLQSSTGYSAKNSCRHAILRLNLLDKPPDQQVPLLKEALLEDGYWHVRQWAGLRLGGIGTDEAGHALARVAKNEKAPGRDAALKGLQMGVKKGHWKQEVVGEWMK